MVQLPFAGRRLQPELLQLWRREFAGYSRDTARRDLIAGLTVAAVALPLALAFGVASGSTPAAGLVTAIVGGFIIGVLSGAPYQVSGPTGAMSAVLIVIAQQHGVRGLWVAGLMSAVIILAIGVFRLGRIVNLIPAPVITGFTSGIACVIAIGQIDNFLGIKTPANDRAAEKFLHYFLHPLPAVNWSSIACGLLVIAVMIGLPRVWKAPGVPVALIGIALATLLNWATPLDAGTIGKVSVGLVMDDHFSPRSSDLDLARSLIGPALAIAMLGAIESLLCGVVAGRMAGKKLAVNQELVAQGIGNIVLPFVGGVPATAAIARTSVGVKAGGATRLVAIIHSVALLLGGLFFASLIRHIPVAALSGVLFVTAWRMNEWHAIHFYRLHRLKGAVATFFVTMLATVEFNLSEAIAAGVVVSLALFLAQVARLHVTVEPVDWAKLDLAPDPLPDVQVIYVTGPLFFGSVNQFVERVEELPFARSLILSMRGVPMADVSSVQAIEHLWREHRAQGGTVFVTGLQPQVRRMMERSGLVREMGEGQFLWSADQALRVVAGAPSMASWAPAPVADDDGFGDLPLGVVPSA